MAHDGGGGGGPGPINSPIINWLIKLIDYQKHSTYHFLHQTLYTTHHIHTAHIVVDTN